MAEQTCCEKEIIELEQKLSKLEIQLTAEKEDYQKALIENLKKDLQINEMEDKIESNLYHQFKESFNDKTLNKLRMIENSTKYD